MRRLPLPDDDDQSPIVPFVPFRCPRCGAGKPFTYGQRGLVRYHSCQFCSTKYRSRELRPEDVDFCGAESPETPCG